MLWAGSRHCGCPVLLLGAVGIVPSGCSGTCWAFSVPKNEGSKTDSPGALHQTRTTTSISYPCWGTVLCPSLRQLMQMIFVIQIAKNCNLSVRDPNGWTRQCRLPGNLCDTGTEPNKCKCNPDVQRLWDMLMINLVQHNSSDSVCLFRAVWTQWIFGLPHYIQENQITTGMIFSPCLALLHVLILAVLSGNSFHFVFCSDNWRAVETYAVLTGKRLLESLSNLEKKITAAEEEYVSPKRNLPP